MFQELLCIKTTMYQSEEATTFHPMTAFQTFPNQYVTKGLEEEKQSHPLILASSKQVQR